MHKKYFNFILPIFGAAVVVGSGFAAWVFSDEVSANTSIEGEVVLQPLATLSAGLTADVKSFTLDLDQGGIDSVEADKGITFKYLKEGETEEASTTTNVLPINITYTLTSSTPLLDEDWEAITAEAANEYTVAVTVPTEVVPYVSVVADTSDAAAKLSFTKSTTVDNTYVATATFNLVATYTTKNDEDGKKGKPTSAAEYNAMSTAFGNLTGKKINVTVAATTFKDATPTV